MPRSKTQGKSKSYPTYTDEEKESWYKGSSLSTLEKKYCRCLLEQADNELRRYRSLQGRSSWAICSASVTHKKETPTGRKQRKGIQKISLGGLCSKNLNVEALPTPLLYAYCKLREKKFKTVFSFQLPSPAVFYKDPEHYRASLIQKIQDYIEAEKEKTRRN